MATQSGIVITGTDNDGIVLSNPATDDPATVAATGYVTNDTATHDYDAIYGEPGYSWTVTNLGQIEGVGQGAGVHLTDGGVVTNGQHGSSTGLTKGGNYGVNIEGGS
jgi:hypothetical protein